MIYIRLTDEKDIKFFRRTLDLLDEDDDVQEVYHNRMSWMRMGNNHQGYTFLAIEIQRTPFSKAE